MVTITKKQAKENNIIMDFICIFHKKFPDQQATFDSCEGCVIIKDPCGCGMYDGCIKCDPNSFNTEKLKEGK